MLRRIRSSTTLALLLSPVGVLLLAATRLLIVSDYDLNTALAILQSSGYVNTLLGSIISLVPIVMPYIALLMLYLGQMVASILALAATILITPAAATGTAALSFARHDWDLMIGGSTVRHVFLAILATAFGVFILAELMGFGIRISVRSAGMAAIVIVLPLLVHLYPLPVRNSFYTSLLAQPWLPAEQLTLASHQVVTGYVLESDQDWFEVMLAGDRTVVHYRTSQVTARSACQIVAVAQQRPLFPLVTTRSRLPGCSAAAAFRGSAKAGTR